MRAASLLPFLAAVGLMSGLVSSRCGTSLKRATESCWNRERHLCLERAILHNRQ